MRVYIYLHDFNTKNSLNSRPHPDAKLLMAHFSGSRSLSSQHAVENDGSSLPPCANRPPWQSLHAAQCRLSRLAASASVFAAIAASLSAIAASLPAGVTAMASCAAFSPFSSHSHMEAGQLPFTLTQLRLHQRSLVSELEGPRLTHGALAVLGALLLGVGLATGAASCC